MLIVVIDSFCSFFAASRGCNRILSLCVRWCLLTKRSLGVVVVVVVFYPQVFMYVGSLWLFNQRARYFLTQLLVFRPLMIQCQYEPCIDLQHLILSTQKKQDFNLQNPGRPNSHFATLFSKIRVNQNIRCVEVKSIRTVRADLFSYFPPGMSGCWLTRWLPCRRALSLFANRLTNTVSWAALGSVLCWVMPTLQWREFFT